MRVIDFVDPQAIVFRLRSRTPGEALEEMAGALAAAHAALHPRRILALLEQRERLGTTAIGNGVAVPHAKLAELDRLVGAVGLAPLGIAVDAPDRKPARIFVALLSPARDPTGHLHAMAAIARVMSGSRLPERLLAAADARELYGLLADAELIAGD